MILLKALFFALVATFAGALCAAQGNGAAFIKTARAGTQISVDGKQLEIGRNTIIDASGLKISVPDGKSLGIIFSNNVSIMVYGAAEFSVDSLKQNTNTTRNFGKSKEDSASEMKISLFRGTFVFAMSERLLSSVLEIGTPCAKISPISQNLVVSIDDKSVKITPINGIAHLKSNSTSYEIIKSEICAKFVKEDNQYINSSLEKLYIREMESLESPIKCANQLLESVLFIPSDSGKFTVRILRHKSFFSKKYKY